MSLNYGKVSDLLVFDLINRDNPGLPIPVSADNVIVEKITTVSVNAASNNRNTQVRLRGIQGMGFRDSITLYYDRVQIGRIVPWWNYGASLRDAGAAITNFTAKSIHELLPSIFDKYGINFSPKDINDGVLSNAGVNNSSQYYTIQSTVNSPAYIGGVTALLKRGLPVLDTSITVDTIPVLNHPIDISKGQACVDLLTFGIDFTAYKNLLTVTSAGLPQWDGLRALLDSLGVPSYAAPVTSNVVADVATKGNQYANQAYDRVVIQTDIDNDGIKGVAYYHYNN